MKLCILTVSFGHKTLLTKNRALTDSLNRSGQCDIEWHVVENSPPDFPDRFSGNEAGFIFHNLRGENGLGISHHHASALNQLIKHVTIERFAVILDPDFYLLMPDWARRIPEYMTSKNLGSFGVPWHPKHNQNYRYFPAVHCFFFDTTVVTAADLDFSPRLDVLENQKTLFWRSISKIPIIGYRIVSQSWDTGTKVWEKFGHGASHRSDVVTPIHSPSRLSRSTKNRLIELFLPEAWHLEPGKPGYFSEIGFDKRGWISNPLPSQWEQFVWNDQRFGLHVRRSYSSHSRNQIEEDQCLDGILNELVEHSSSSINAPKANSC